MRTVKTPETDNRVVDYLYDDLPDVQREEFSTSLESDEEAAAEAQYYASLLKVYRAESDELTPSVAATEKLLREAERAHLSLWARLFGSLAPRLVLRPAVGFAVVAALVIGGGVFYVLSQGMGPGHEPGRGSGSDSEAASGPDRTVARAPSASPTTGDTRTVATENAPAGATGKVSQTNNKADFDGKQDKGLVRAGAESRVAGDGYLYKSNKEGALAAGRDRALDRSERKGLRGRKGRRLRKAKAYFSLTSKTGSGGAPRSPRPAAKLVREPTPQATNSVRAVQKAPAGTRAAPKAAPKDAVGKRLSPPALHNSARKNLAKGQVAVACRMFGSLVRGHRSYNRRADALLGWARCEMARGSYSHAMQLVRQLLREYPKWKKTGATLVAQIKRRQARSALRAQRVRRVRRRVAPRRARPAPRARSQRSTTSSD